jgi:hypothetical protein
MFRPSNRSAVVLDRVLPVGRLVEPHLNANFQEGLALLFGKGMVG